MVHSKKNSYFYLINGFFRLPDVIHKKTYRYYLLKFLSYAIVKLYRLCKDFVPLR